MHATYCSAVPANEAALSCGTVVASVPAPQHFYLQRFVLMGGVFHSACATRDGRIAKQLFVKREPRCAEIKMGPISCVRWKQRTKAVFEFLRIRCSAVVLTALPQVWWRCRGPNCFRLHQSWTQLECGAGGDLHAIRAGLVHPVDGLQDFYVAGAT